MSHQHANFEGEGIGLEHFWQVMKVVIALNHFFTVYGQIGRSD